MEFLLRPNHLARPLTRVPYVCRERYDGLDWVSFPARVGIQVPASTPWSSLNPDQRYNLIQGHLSIDRTDFIQTYLFFGIISEFLGGNSTQPDPLSIAHTADAASSKSLRLLYDNTVLEDAEGLFVSTSKLIPMLDGVRKNLPPEISARQEKYRHLASCLQQAWHILSILGPVIDPVIRDSAAVMCEFFAHVTNYALRRVGVDDVTCRLQWGTGYIGSDIRESMLSAGWCPSDIARAGDRFKSLQSLHLIQLLDRSRPPRDHSRCNDELCYAGQIDLARYQVAHYDKQDCKCEEISPDSSEVIHALEPEYGFPLLRITGTKADMKIEVVSYEPGTSYVAISHVWADGLGNPIENSLHRCQLEHLRAKVSMIYHSSGTPNHGPASAETVLIWLDTLCCPTRPASAKKRAIEKMRSVYEKAEHVLVLDKCLQEYKAADMDISEQIARIFTSGWMRRLWTLQEGALAKSLQFQFSDGPVSMDNLQRQLAERGVMEMRYKWLYYDFSKEYSQIRSFFQGSSQTPRIPVADIRVLDQALHHRGVSVASDEPLCIATLMSMPLEDILTAGANTSLSKSQTMEEKTQDLMQARMQIFWTLLAEKNGGIPVQCIFLGGEKLDLPGWRWAPRSLIQTEKGIYEPNTRFVKWRDQQLGQPRPLGLQVKYPGLELQIKSYNNPRFGTLPSVAEEGLALRDTEGQWYYIIDRDFSFQFSTWTESEREAWRAKKLHPLRDLLSSGPCAVLASGSLERDSGEKTSCGGILGYSMPRAGFSNDAAGTDGIVLRTKMQVTIHVLPESQTIIYDTMERLVIRLRADPLTDALMGMEDPESGEHQLAVANLIRKMKNVMQEAQQNEDFSSAVRNHIGAGALEHVWVLVADRFSHDMVATRLESDQMWYVD